MGMLSLVGLFIIRIAAATAVEMEITDIGTQQAYGIVQAELLTQTGGTIIPANKTGITVKYDKDSYKTIIKGSNPLGYTNNELNLIVVGNAITGDAASNSTYSIQTTEGIQITGPSAMATATDMISIGFVPNTKEFCIAIFQDPFITSVLKTADYGITSASLPTVTPAVEVTFTSTELCDIDTVNATDPSYRNMRLANDRTVLRACLDESANAVNQSLIPCLMKINNVLSFDALCKTIRSSCAPQCPGTETKPIPNTTSAAIYLNECFKSTVILEFCYNNTAFNRLISNVNLPWERYVEFCNGK